MKDYVTTFPEYGQSVTGRIAYYQKMGVAQGIIKLVKRSAENKGLNLDNWKHKETFSNVELTFFSMTVVVPTPANFRKVVHTYPSFAFDGKRGIIDMLNVQSELQFHIMLVDWENKTFINGHWHTVRECLNLEDTCTLFEYIEDRLKELIVLAPEESTKYNSTGALGVEI